MKLSIIIPVFNEKDTIEEVFKRLEALPGSNFEKEIIAVDDHSTDGTMELLQKLESKYNFVLLDHIKNMGKGAAIKTALQKVTGDYVIFQDADLEYDPEEYLKLTKALSHDFPVVFGSRNLEPRQRGYLYCFLGVAILTKIINILFSSNLTDAYTCYKLIPAKLIKTMKIESNGFEIEAEITIKILKRKTTIKEIPINYHPRTYEKGKKIRVMDGLIGLYTILKLWII